MGAQSLQLTVWEFNKDALAFYTSLGMHTRNRRLELDVISSLSLFFLSEHLHSSQLLLLHPLLLQLLTDV